MLRATRLNVIVPRFGAGRSLFGRSHRKLLNCFDQGTDISGVKHPAPPPRISEFRRRPFQRPARGGPRLRASPCQWFLRCWSWQSRPGRRAPEAHRLGLEGSGLVRGCRGCPPSQGAQALIGTVVVGVVPHEQPMEGGWQLCQGVKGVPLAFARVQAPHSPHQKHVRGQLQSQRLSRFALVDGLRGEPAFVKGRGSTWQRCSDMGVLASTPP